MALKLLKKIFARANAKKKTVLKKGVAKKTTSARKPKKKISKKKTAPKKGVAKKTTSARKPKKKISKKKVSKKKTVSKKGVAKKTTSARKPKKKISKKKVSKKKAVPKKGVAKRHVSLKKRKNQPQKEIGVVTHYFGKISVGIIKVNTTLRVGQKIQIKGAHVDFSQVVESMQVNHKSVLLAPKGAEVGIKVKRRVHPNDRVYKKL